jgi:anti-sigma B factor antagonist
MRSVSQWFAGFGSAASGERQVGRVTILDLEGGITFGGGTADLRQQTRRLIAEGRTDILLNLAGVRYVDSSGLGEMVAAQTAARRVGGRVAVLSPSANVRELLKVTALTGVFDIYEDESAAIAGM